MQSSIHTSIHPSIHSFIHSFIQILTSQDAVSGLKRTSVRIWVLATAEFPSDFTPFPTSLGFDELIVAVVVLAFRCLRIYSRFILTHFCIPGVQIFTSLNASITHSFKLFSL